MAEAVGGVDLLDATAQPLEQTGRVLKGGDGGSRSLVIGAAVLGLLVVVGLVLVVGGGADEEIVDEESTEETDEGTADADAVEADEAGTTSSTIPREAFALDNQGIESAPRFGRELTYRLLIPTTGGLAVYNSNDGEIVYHESTSISPVVALDGWLVGQPSGIQQLVRVPLEDLSAEPEIVFPDADFAMVTGGIGEEGLVAALVLEAGAQRLAALDMATGEEVAHPLLDRDDLPLFWLGVTALGRESGAFTAASGGVYAVDGVEIGRISPGRLVAADPDRLLVERCDDSFRCEMVWVDQDGEPLDLTVPPGSPDIGYFVNGTDWLATTSLDFVSGELAWTLSEVVRDRTVETQSDRYGGFSPAGSLPAVSPDGRWLAEVGDDATSVVLTNLVADSSVVIPLDERITDGLLYTDG